ncbi:4Fe-4S single cluster domain-containing protein [Paenibacillus glucanolyticus]|jgi:anaerobic ribonucleoside-triphosphate reductase activating protein|uniref:Anaerobic ribonucleoside-triphosphate reductase-activating protein n=1 Tax=Paenibacillus glucanolyticus TaxID=59843 RepID=A0A163GK66_9BACL|nr:4Fe-4S single cluster domain-containing protein [Paenibacillus glucanolyticus]KZS45015.1 hypothetical protein AWU65_03270 [Paenibacillus glucanolyticus]OMF66748.1 hypothetical protein BK142_29445 [Paenibacillus glucanolyticus]
MRIHSFTPSTLVNGPGNRAMIHFQGCTLNCPGCFNAFTHSMTGGMDLSVEDLLKLIPPEIEGVTISGGEPFLQSRSLLQLVEAIRQKNKSIVVFSGFYRHEISNMKYGPDILSHIDVLIDGRFEREDISESGIRGSNNQTIHLITDRYTIDQFQERNVEVTIDSKGAMSMTGFPSEKLRADMRFMGV